MFTFSQFSKLTAAAATKFSNLSRLGKVGVVTAAATTGIATNFVVHQKRQTVKGTDEFAEHTREQLKKHWVSGMHEPFITKDKKAIELFRQNFPELSHLLPNNVEEFQNSLAEKTPVQIRPIEECPVSTAELEKTNTILSVGGPPALILAAAEAMDGNQDVIYACNNNWQIAYGSAFHVEEDGDAEAPTGLKPRDFIMDQIRLFFKRKSYEEIEKTGLYPWRTLDVIGFLKHPEEWLSALSVAIKFEKKKSMGPEFRKAEVDKVSEQCVFNEQLFNKLNEEMGGKLLLSGRGGLVIARNEQEIADLEAQKKNLEKEGRTFSDVSPDDLMKKYGFAIKGQAFKVKDHDAVLAGNYKKSLSKYIQEKGGKVFEGTLETIYTNPKKEGGIAKFRTPNGDVKYIPFKRGLLSLGNQAIIASNGKSLFNRIQATGSSGRALVFTPKNTTLPRVGVYGGTNHVTLLSEKPVPVNRNGKEMDVHVLGFTAGAAVTPANRGKGAGNHDGTISVGLVSSVKDTLGIKDRLGAEANDRGNGIEMEILAVKGCNRVIGENGQTTYIKINNGLTAQVTPGGGGITRAPDALNTDPNLKSRVLKKPRPSVR